MKGDQWLVHVSNDSDIGSFFQIRYMMNCGVRIRRFRQNGLVQCHNCQRFGHISTNCNLEFRCVKCGQSHGPKNCTIPQKDLNNEKIISKDPISGAFVTQIGLPVMCANCKVEGHVASARSCPKRKEILWRIEERRNAKNSRNIETPRRPPMSGRVDGRQYSQVLGGNPPVNSGRGVMRDGPAPVADTGDTFNLIDNDCRRLLGKDFLTCMSKINDFSTRYRRITDEGEKSKALFSLLLSIRLDA